MPTFDFICQDCQHPFELLLRARDTVACPKCQSADVEKQLSMPLLKTSGTHALAMKAAKRRDKAQGIDRVFEQAKYEASHDD